MWQGLQALQYILKINGEDTWVNHKGALRQKCQHATLHTPHASHTEQHTARAVHGMYGRQYCEKG